MPTPDILDDTLFDGIAMDSASLLQYMLICFLGRFGRYEIVLVIGRAKGLLMLHLFNTEASLVADELPVVFSLLTLHDVIGQIPQRGACERLALTGLTQFYQHIIMRMSRTGLVVVAHEVALMTASFTSLVLTAIA